MNHEGYRDVVAETAIRHHGHLPEHIWTVIKIVRSLVEFTGLELTEITVTDKRRKREYNWEGSECRKK